MFSKMDMEGSIGNNEPLAKGKRTKRGIRMLSPCTVANTTVTSSCSSATGGGGGGRSFSSTTFDSTEEEEEADMANCLILLAQGRTGGQEDNQNPRCQNHHDQQVGGGYNNIVTEKATRNGFESYECKTCNRFFHSFQALGGHRASHKKPKMKEIISAGEFEEENNHFHNKNVSLVPPVSLELTCGGNLNFHGHGNNIKLNRSNKIHECSICGAEFTSGQALGGHMRRHRACTNKNNNNNNNNNNVGDIHVHVKSRNVLELDLNLPAPEEDLRDSTFQFPAMVGCHY